MFDVSSTVFVRYCTVCGLEREGGHLFDVSSTVLGAILNCEWIGEGGGTLV